MPCAAPRILRRALAAPRLRSAMHAIDGCSRRRNRRRFRDRAISVGERDLGPSPYTGQVLILIPGRTAAVVVRRPVPRSRADSPIWRISSIADRASIARGSGGVAENREEDSHHPR